MLEGHGSSEAISGINCILIFCCSRLVMVISCHLLNNFLMMSKLYLLKIVYFYHTLKRARGVGGSSENRGQYFEISDSLISPNSSVYSAANKVRF